MTKLLKHSLAWGFVGVCFAVVFGWPRPCRPRCQRNFLISSRSSTENYVEKIPESDVSFEMIAIPGGTFMMGSPAGEKGRGADEGPQHPVKIRPFWMEKSEVAVG